MKNTFALIAIFAIILLFPQKRGIPNFPASMNINKGGCGYFAKYYHQRYPNSQIINFYSPGYSKRHFMVYFPTTGEYVDCEGCTKYPRWLIYDQRTITPEQLDSTLNTGGWKKDFNKADTTIIKNKIFEQCW